MATNRVTPAQPASVAPAWHSLSTEHALTAIRSSVAGLTTDEARERLRVYGPNELARAKGDGPL
ncbi:MAG: cation-transporting P-type ATPase, partial [Dehalococcoidia bacterium]|nr:cation-transporting P-type ATPase [Dehalococcoidia bacterium]